MIARDRSTQPADFPIELLDPQEMARADAITAQTMPSIALMERAGAAVAQAALRMLPTSGARRVTILCGPGNNGGDGYVAARLLADEGCDVEVAVLGRAALKGDAAIAAAGWRGPVVELAAARLEGTDLVVDALFGAGLARDIEGPAKDAIACVNEWAETTGGKVLAVDIPSGVDGASGAIRGSAVAAHESVTFFRLKPGHVLMPGREKCGRLVLEDIGIAASVLAEIAPPTRLNVPALWLDALPRPGPAGHKYARGHALVVSGPMSQTGAARLCARGALRVGAGLVTVATPRDALPIHAAALTAIMTRVADDAAELSEILADRRKNAVALGPGLGVGDGTRALVLAALAAPASEANAPPRCVVLDADALTSFAETSETLFQAIAASTMTVVLTPHDGEFAKLFGSFIDKAAAKPERTRAAAKRSGAIVLLKGADTVVATPDGRAAIAASDAPWLATAGSGDVLSGFVTGLLAQAMPGFEAAAAAVWLHAEAARRFGPGLISEDLPDLLPGVLRDLLHA